MSYLYAKLISTNNMNTLSAVVDPLKYAIRIKTLALNQYFGNLVKG
jgi:hypothetical protein